MAALKLKSRTLFLIILLVAIFISIVFLFKNNNLIFGIPTFPNASQTQEISNEESMLAAETRRSIKKCGQIPDDETLKIERDHFRIISLRVWSPNCEYVAWSVWQSGTSGIENLGPYSHEGIFVYSKSSANVVKVYSLQDKSETPEFLGWADDNSIRFAIYENSNRKVLIFDLISKTLNSE